MEQKRRLGSGLPIERSQWAGPVKKERLGGNEDSSYNIQAKSILGNGRGQCKGYKSVLGCCVGGRIERSRELERKDGKGK